MVNKTKSKRRNTKEKKTEGETAMKNGKSNLNVSTPLNCVPYPSIFLIQRKREEWHIFSFCKNINDNKLTTSVIRGR